MKFDMCGAAGVLGAFKAVASSSADQRGRRLPACENMPGGRAPARRHRDEHVRPDDRGAEHRRRRPPDPVRRDHLLTPVQAAKRDRHRDTDRRVRRRARRTSTRGCSATTTTSPRRSAQPGERAHDRAWRLPIGEEYGEPLRSNFADFANVAGREGGAITAACFLASFAAGLPWAHLDIAGTAYQGGPQKGSTGRPVPLLVDYLLNK